MMEFSEERVTAELPLGFKYSEVGVGNWGEQILKVHPSLSPSSCLLHPDITSNNYLLGFALEVGKVFPLSP